MKTKKIQIDKTDILDYAGILTNTEASKIKRTVIEAREKSKARMDRISRKLNK